MKVGKIIFAKQGGNVPKQGKQRGIRNLWSMIKKGKKEKRSSEILADENGKNFREKVKFGKLSTESENFSKIGVKSEIGGTCIMASGGIDAPVYCNGLWCDNQVCACLRINEYSPNSPLENPL